MGCRRVGSKGWLGLALAACALAACGDDGASDAPGMPDAHGPLDGPGLDSAALDGPARDAVVVDGPPAAGRWVLGYYVGYQVDLLPIAEIDWSALTHIAFAPMTVKPDLTLDLSFDDTHGMGIQRAMDLSTAAHAHGVKALLMLGGANAGPPIRAAASPANLTTFVQRLTGTMDTLGFDGIDLDWEDDVDLDELVALAQALRAARPTMLITYPPGTINGNFQTVDPRVVTLAQSLDYFDVQTYYPSTAFNGQGWSSWFMAPLSGVTPQTPIAIDDTLQRFADAGIPKAKLGMGVGFYAICYTGGITGPRQPTSGSTGIAGGDNNYPLAAFFAVGSTFDTHPAARMRDATAKQPYLAFTTPITEPHCGGAQTSYIPYEDEQSIADKGAFARAQGYGGIIVWTLAEGYLPAAAAGGRPRNALTQALKHAFLD